MKNNPSSGQFLHLKMSLSEIGKFFSWKCTPKFEFYANIWQEISYLKLGIFSGEKITDLRK